MTKRADNNVARSRNKILALVPSRFVPAAPDISLVSSSCRLTENKATGGGVHPTMIGGARSAKSPRDQAYIYFACFEGRAAGGCRERKAWRENGKETDGGRPGRARERKDRGPRNNAAYGACSSRATTRDAVQLPAASSVGSRTKPRASSYRVVAPLSALPSCGLRSTLPGNVSFCLPFPSSFLGAAFFWPPGFLLSSFFFVVSMNSIPKS